MTSKKILHVGCGSDPLPEWLKGIETRVDIDANVHPDIIANMTNLGDIGTFDIVLARHTLEHLAPHEVGTALKEFGRVLNKDGSVIVFVPDLQDVKATDEVLFISPAGQIAGLDLMYGFRKALAECPYMAHKTGFVSDTLKVALEQAGFEKVVTTRLGNYDLMGVGKKGELNAT